MAWTRDPSLGDDAAMARGSSPTLIGRADDLERLRAALAGTRTHDRPVVLVSGEAGIGKSRLLAEFAASATADPPDGRPVRFVHGGCLEVGETLAYLPILEWLDELAGDGGERGTEARLLHDQFGGSVGPAGADGDMGPGRSTRLQRLRDAIAAATADADVVAVIDDLHWADRSTLDVVSFLARRLAGTNVLLVLAFRSDELHRRHPLTPVVAELERHATLDHIRLAPLGSDDVRAQIDAIEGRSADAGDVARVVALADGNPFHVEELLALEGSGPLPDSLRDVLDARLGQVDDGTLEILREAAVIGRRVDAALLATISRAGDAAVDDGIRTAVGARLLVADPDGRHYRFRHALLREAVYDDMRPVERIATHRRIAEALTARPDLGDPSPGVALAERAHHWLAARAEPEAFVALIESGRAARAAYAWAEGRQAFEEALALWDRVPDPGSAGVARSRLLQDAAAMTWYMGDTRAALSLNRRTQAEPDVQADPPRLARLIDHEAWYVGGFGDLELAAIAPSHPDQARGLESDRGGAARGAGWDRRRRAQLASPPPSRAATMRQPRLGTGLAQPDDDDAAWQGQIACDTAPNGGTPARAEAARCSDGPVGAADRGSGSALPPSPLAPSSWHRARRPRHHHRHPARRPGQHHRHLVPPPPLRRAPRRVPRRARRTWTASLPTRSPTLRRSASRPRIAPSRT